MALAGDYDGFLFDLDGVVWLGAETIPGAPEALSSLLEAGKPIVFLTNNPRSGAAEYAARLQGEGVGVGAERIVTAGAVTADLVAASPAAGRGALVIGTDSFKDEIERSNVRVLSRTSLSTRSREKRGKFDEEVGVVVVSGHSGFDYSELLAATRALRAGAELFATNRDPTMPMPDGLWPGTGSILAAVETASGARATVGGKPSHHIFERAREMVGPGRVAMVGDRLDSDIGGAADAGLETVLVLSGSTSREVAERSEVRPGQIIDSVADLIR